MADRSSTPESPRYPSSTALAVLITLSLLAILGLGWLWFTRYAPVHFQIGPDASITDARNAVWIIPIILLGVFLIALMWLLVWIRAGWKITVLPLAVGIVGVLALVFAGREFWEGVNASQPIVVTGYVCDSDATRVQGRTDRIPIGCDPVEGTNMAGTSIGTFEDPQMLEAEGMPASGDSIEFRDLPPGIYDALMTTTAQPETASVILVAETEDGVRAVSRLDRVEGETWSGDIALHPNLEEYGVLMYSSPYAEAPDAEIRIAVQQCGGTSFATFDASACEPVSVSSSPLLEVPPEDVAKQGRPIDISIKDGVVVMTNLEERTYAFRPRDTRSDMLVIPADGPQTSDRNVLEVDAASPQGSFTVEIDSGTNEVDYTVYVFDRAPVVATTDAPQDAVMAAGVRPYLHDGTARL